MRLPLPFLHRGGHAPATGLTTQAILGFLLPFILIVVTAVLAYFVIRAGIPQG